LQDARDAPRVRENGRQPLGPDHRDRLAGELRKADAKLKRGNVLDLVLPTSSQIITICGTWHIAPALGSSPR
jgi:hypothetical protein